jgi:hypothetical protein
MDKQTASNYVRSNFEPNDRLAVVLIHRPSGGVTQRFSTADRIASAEYQGWLRHMNAQKHEVYIAMNAIIANSFNRTKSDVAAIRHVYLDFDHDGTARVEAMRKRDDIPQPSYLLSTSPDKWQAVWKVEGFELEQAERLMRGLVREFGADPAATDASRVMRLPGLYNHKYEKPHLVRVEEISREAYRPEHFPKVAAEDPGSRVMQAQTHRARAERARTAGTNTQSEHDWAYARRALARGDDPVQVIRAIALFRSDKPNPHYYATHTVEKAVSAKGNTGDSRSSDDSERSR